MSLGALHEFYGPCTTFSTYNQHSIQGKVVKDLPFSTFSPGKFVVTILPLIGVFIHPPQKNCPYFSLFLLEKTIEEGILRL